MCEQTYTTKENKALLHELRKRIDSNIEFVKSLKSKPTLEAAYRELALTFTKLQEAKMWGGKSLEAIGSELPLEFRDKSK